jgi:hypothetical protein
VDGLLRVRRARLRSGVDEASSTSTDTIATISHDYLITCYDCSISPTLYLKFLWSCRTGVVNQITLALLPLNRAHSTIIEISAFIYPLVVFTK